MNMKTTPNQARDFADSLWGSGSPDDEVDMIRGLATQIEELTMANKELINWFDALKTDHDALKDAARLALTELIEIKENGLSWDAEYDKAIAALKAVLK